MDDKGIPEGAVAFSIDGNMADILHLEVYRDLRRQGIATSLVRVLLKYLSLAEVPFVLQVDSRRN